MARWPSVLIMLLAQVMALLSPACFVQCVSADGQHRIELTGQSCHCCEVEQNDHKHETDVCRQTVGACCHHDTQDESQQEDASLPSFVQDHCSCLHSPIPMVSGVCVKTSFQEIGVNLMSSVALPTWAADPEFAGPSQRSLQVNLLRPLLDAHLVALATTVLRV